MDEEATVSVDDNRSKKDASIFLVGVGDISLSKSVDWSSIELVGLIIPFFTDEANVSAAAILWKKDSVVVWLCCLFLEREESLFDIVDLGLGLNLSFWPYEAKVSSWASLSKNSCDDAEVLWDIDDDDRTEFISIIFKKGTYSSRGRQWTMN